MKCPHGYEVDGFPFRHKRGDFCEYLNRYDILYGDIPLPSDLDSLRDLFYVRAHCLTADILRDFLRRSYEEAEK